MKKWWIEGLLIVTFLFLANPVLAARWHINLGGEYGIYNLSLGEINEFNQGFESWTKEMGIDFEIGDLKNAGSVYSICGRLETSSRWEIGVDLNYRLIDQISESKYVTIPLQDGEKSIDLSYDLYGGIGFVDLIDYYKFNPGKRFSPFIGAGVGNYFVFIDGDYCINEETFTPPWHYEYKYLDESFSVSDSALGYILAAGIDYMVVKSVFDIRIGLEARYHWVPKVKGEFCVDNEGFSSLPVDPEPFEIDPSGLSTRIWIVARF